MFLKQINNWRVEKNLNKGIYCFLIEVNHWAIELKENEFNSLYHVLNSIHTEFMEIHNTLMKEEHISLEIERTPWYVELQGNKNDWSLRMIFESVELTRSFQMYWPIPIAKPLFFEIKKMWESMQ